MTKLAAARVCLSHDVVFLILSFLHLLDSPQARIYSYSSNMRSLAALLTATAASLVTARSSQHVGKKGYENKPRQVTHARDFVPEQPHIHKRASPYATNAAASKDFGRA